MFFEFLAKKHKGEEGAPQSPCLGPLSLFPAYHLMLSHPCLHPRWLWRGKGIRYSQLISPFDLRTATVRLRRGEAQAGRAPARHTAMHSTSTFFGHTIVCLTISSMPLCRVKNRPYKRSSVDITQRSAQSFLLSGRY